MPLPIVEALTFAVSGFLFGATAGISPGPLLTLVISETLQHDRLAGMKVAAAPLITDGPILFVSLLVLTKLSGIDFVLGTISLLGAGFLGYLGYESLSTKGTSVQSADVDRHPLRKGILTNALSPHPYLFYMSVGGPIMVKAQQTGVATLALFVCAFLFSLIVSKIIIAILVERSKAFLTSNTYLYILKFLGLAMLVFGIVFLHDALALFGIL